MSDDFVPDDTEYEIERDLAVPSTYHYAMLLRPAASFTLPPGLSWDYAEAPANIAARRGLPVSTVYPHGVIRTTRKLTADEVESFDLKEL